MLKEDTRTDSLEHNLQPGANNAGGCLLEPGHVIDDRITIESLLGIGAMGAVYRAHQYGVERPVAVKVLHMAHAVAQEGVSRFFREARLLSTLDHPNIVKVYAVSTTDNGQPYLVLDLVEGPTLSDAIRTGEIKSLSDYIALFEQILSALAHAHGRGIVHRDIKPRNILLEPHEGNSRPRLVDFGIARLVEGPEQKLTITGAILGSPAYMSPEQCMGKTLDARSDLYSLACVMYETLCQRPPFLCDSAAAYIHAHVSQRPTSLSERQLPFTVPPELITLIEVAMQKHPDARYQTAEGMLNDLRKIARGETLNVTAPVASVNSSAPAKVFAARTPAIMLSTAIVFSALLIGCLQWQAVQKAQQQQERSLRQQAEIQADTYIKKGWASRMRGHWQQAEKSFVRAQIIFERLGATPEQMADILADRAAMNHHMGRYSSSNSLYLRAQQLLTKEDDRTRDRPMEIERNYGWSLVDQRRDMEAIKVLQDADRLATRHAPAEDEATADRVHFLEKLIEVANKNGAYDALVPAYRSLIDCQVASHYDQSTIACSKERLSEAIKRAQSSPK